MTKKVNRPSGIHIHNYYLDKLAPQLIKLRRQGLSYEKISKELNIPKPSLHRYLTKHIFNNKTPKQQAELIELIHTPLPKEEKIIQPKIYNKKSNIIIKKVKID